MQGYWILKHVVHRVTTVLYSVNPFYAIHKRAVLKAQDFIVSIYLVFEFNGRKFSSHLLTIRLFSAPQVFITETHTIAVATKLHDSRSQQNRITLQHEQRSPGERRQLTTRSVAKLAPLYCWLGAAREGGGGGVLSPSVTLKHAIWWQLLWQDVQIQRSKQAVKMCLLPLLPHGILGNTGQFKNKVTLSYVYNEVTNEPTITRYATIVRKTLKVCL
jgi:hypothetical protein